MIPVVSLDPPWCLCLKLVEDRHQPASKLAARARCMKSPTIRSKVGVATFIMGPSSSGAQQGIDFHRATKFQVLQGASLMS